MGRGFDTKTGLPQCQYREAIATLVTQFLLFQIGPFSLEQLSSVYQYLGKGLDSTKKLQNSMFVSNLQGIYAGLVMKVFSIVGE